MKGLPFFIEYFAAIRRIKVKYIMQCIKRIILPIALFAMMIGCIKGGEAPEQGGTKPVTQPEAQRMPRPASLDVHATAAQAVEGWIKDGLKGLTIVHVSPASGIGGNKGNSGSATTRRDFLSAAIAKGMVERIYWVLPYGLFNDIPLAAERVKTFLKTTAPEFDHSEIEAMRMEQGCLAGMIGGVDMRICSPFTMPTITGRTMLVMDASFIPPFAFENGASKLFATKILFDTIGHKLPDLAHADVVVGVRDGSLKPIHHYLALQAYDILNNPEILDSPPPELWKMRDNAENMYSGGESDLVIEDLSVSLKAYPDDRPLRMLEAAALARTGKVNEALARTKELCKEQEDYCYALAYLASELESEGRAKESEPFGREATRALGLDNPMGIYRRDAHSGMQGADR